MSGDRKSIRARYSNVERRMWNDPRFRGLSHMQPSGQALWLYLLTTPHMGSLPGLIAIGEAAMAEDLGWDIKGFRTAFAELEAQGMVEADWKARVVIIPKAIARDRPESLNVVKSWRRQWFDVPDCELKDRYFEALRVAIEGMSAPFRKAFNETFREAIGDTFDDAIAEPSPKASNMPSAKASAMPSRMACVIQEQEQEQDQEAAVLDPPPKIPTRDPDPPPVEPEPAAAAAAAPGSAEEAEQAIRSELRKHAAFDRLDPWELSKALARVHMTNTVHRLTELPWTLTAIADAATDCAGQGLSGREIAKTLRNYVNNAKPPRQPKPSPAETEPLAQRIPEGVPDYGPILPLEVRKANAERAMARFNELQRQRAQEAAGSPIEASADQRRGRDSQAPPSPQSAPAIAPVH